jgi:antitoxin (DNA-binding transcriptional repressor) of toxin-antitoxin stability system
MHMNVITLPIGKGRNQLCSLVPKIKAGAKVILTSHGEPQVVITAYHSAAKPWRLDKPDNPARYGDLDSQVM